MRIVNEMLVEQSIENAEDCLVQYPVAHGRLVDMPALRVAHEESGVRVVPVSFRNQLAMQFEQIVFKIQFELGNIFFPALSPLELIPCREQIW